ncbi:glycosyltransferase [Microbacterium sp. P05]|uniref:glycosyltransferase n=1 Tax=Microbacterium sp. P05 TaxID=3366948 RepID=UPI003744E097
MRISILSAGSRGDVQPSAVLAHELTERGHDVVLGASDDLIRFGAELGVETEPLGFSTRELLDSEEGERWLASGDMRAFLQGVVSLKTERLAGLGRAISRASRGSDVIVSGVNTMEEASAIAEVNGIPLVGLYYSPRRANRFFPAYALTTRSLGGPANRFTYRLVARTEWKATADYANSFRAALGLPPVRQNLTARLRGRHTLELQAYSRALVPQLAGWSAERPLTGFITPTGLHRRLWGEAATDEGLREWLTAGSPPVYFGFGSMPVREPQRMIDLVRRVAARLGVRALIGAGWSTYGGGGDDGTEIDDTENLVRVIGEIDHSSVFPLCVAAVHHGGAGTTAASLTAGLPTLVCSVNFDQPFWGRRVEDLRVGGWLPFDHLSEEALFTALRELLEPAVGERARALGAGLSAESGVSAAADAIENQHLSPGR